ncbi:MAG TPA: M23 family metallopeptidase [Sphingomonas sp.]|jgi:murein DD-endopeptidase MepM/ murein hydrolase activator NlpD|uniref:M23 family metallopeptidase n=1 Tax=Sphingomonas sp. TaxID=28214 RepID=UPI002EDA8787
MRRLVPLLALGLTACIPSARADPPGLFDAPAPAAEAPAHADDPPARRPSPSDTDAPIRTVALGDTPSTPPQVADPPAAWVARKVVPDAVDVPEGRYTVQPGDSLRRISDRTGAGSEAIARANELAAPFIVRRGQVLRIPGGRYHHVRAGETGIAIARAYGTAWDRVIALNDLAAPYVLRLGQRLLIPSAKEVRQMTLEERAAAFKLDIDDLITGSEPALAANAKPAAPVRTARRAVPSTVPVQAPTRFTGRFDWPLSGPILARFGPQGQGRVNEGINIGVPAGTPILAAADGVVAYVGSEIAVYGGLILIKHGGGWITTYGHAEQLLVTRGQAVKRGQIIGRAGETGSAREPQLHFEIRQGRRPVDPFGQLPRRG